MSRKWSAQDKTAIVMEHLTTSIGTAELCCKHNLAPRTFYAWKEAFLKAGKSALSGRGGKEPQRVLARENESLKCMVGELTMINDALKKTLEAGRR